MYCMNIFNNHNKITDDLGNRQTLYFTAMDHGHPHRKSEDTDWVKNLNYLFQLWIDVPFIYVKINKKI